MTMSTTIPAPEATLELLKTRRSIRRYRPDPVPDHMLAQILEAGRWAPSASNRQPWHFVVVRDQAVLNCLELDAVKVGGQVQVSPSLQFLQQLVVQGEPLDGLWYLILWNAIID